MGSSEVVQNTIRNLELVQMQLRSQAEWAARAGATRFSYAAQVFAEVLSSCQAALRHAEEELVR
jgi:hypothetical protein